MSKKIIRLFLTVTCILTLTVCADSTGTDGSTDRPAPGESPSVTEPAAPKASPESFQSPSENADIIIIEKSLLGYSMTYDSALFTLDATNGNDSYIYHTEEALDAPVYISVQACPDMDAPVLAEGISLQSGIDGVTPQDAYFGRDGIETK